MAGELRATPLEVEFHQRIGALLYPIQNLDKKGQNSDTTTVKPPTHSYLLKGTESGVPESRGLTVPVNGNEVQ